MGCRDRAEMKGVEAAGHRAETIGGSVNYGDQSTKCKSIGPK